MEMGKPQQVLSALTCKGIGPIKLMKNKNHFEF